MIEYLVYSQVGERKKKYYVCINKLKFLISKKEAIKWARIQINRTLVVKITVLDSIADACIVFDNTNTKRY